MATEVVAPTISAELTARAEYFDHMLNMIPVAYYYPAEPVDPDEGKFVHNKKASVGQLSQGKKKRKGAPTTVEDETKEAVSVKRTKSEKRQDLFDPANYRTVLSIQQAALAVAPVQPKKAPVAPAVQTPATSTETKSLNNLHIPLPVLSMSFAVACIKRSRSLAINDNKPPPNKTI